MVKILIGRSRYPSICRYCFDALIKHAIGPDVHVLVADDQVLYEDDNHQLYIFASYAVIIAFCFGVPIGAAVHLGKRYYQVPRVDPTLKVRISEAFGISFDEAEAMVNNLAMGVLYGVLTDASKPKYYFTESLDMLRKVLLLGFVAIAFDRGSVAQAVVSLVVSVLFLCLHISFWPCPL